MSLNSVPQDVRQLKCCWLLNLTLRLLCAPPQKSDQLEVVRLLLKNGAKVDEVDYEGKTALIKAAFYGHSIELVRLLIETGGADINRAGKGFRDIICTITNFTISKVFWQTFYYNSLMSSNMLPKRSTYILSLFITFNSF